MKWDGEWQVTIEVFRDLGLAFAPYCILIYMLMVVGSNYTTRHHHERDTLPHRIPRRTVCSRVFYRHSMIGSWRAGIVVRNGIILVDFIELRLREGCRCPA